MVSNLNALPDKERWAVMDRIIAEYAEHKKYLKRKELRA